MNPGRRAKLGVYDRPDTRACSHCLRGIALCPNGSATRRATPPMARPLGKERNAVAGPFGRNPQGLGPLGPHCGVAAPCLADSQAASPRLALGAHWPERDPRRDCQQTLGSWQGLYLWEHRTEPHTRQIVVTVLG